MGIGWECITVIFVRAFSAALIGKLLDLAGAGQTVCPPEADHNILFLLLGIVVIAAAVLFHTAFRAGHGLTGRLRIGIIAFRWNF
jgi:hypothetical protein